MRVFRAAACLCLIVCPVAGAAQVDASLFRGQISGCWAPVEGAGAVAVTVGFSLTPEGLVQDNAVTLVSATPGSEAAVEQAFQSARRAVLRCQGDGYDLPPELYEQWRDVELTFDPRGLPIQ